MSNKQSSLFKNAIDLIECGIEDYRLGEKNQIRYKTALRNLYSGLLLIFKEKLHSIDNNLIYQRLEPSLNEDNKITWQRTGNQTLNTQQIQSRFKSLDINFLKPNSQSDKDFKQIKRVRNDIEHKYTELQSDKIVELIFRIFELIGDFMESELKLNIEDQISEDAYETIRGVQKEYKAQLERCKRSWQHLDTESEKIKNTELYCPNCSSNLIEFDKQSNCACRFCNEKLDRENFLEKFIEKHFYWEHYYSVKEGGEEPVGSCPNCGKDTFIVDEKKCAVCGLYLEDLTCQYCGDEMPVCELGGDNGYCSYCNQVRMKDD